MGDAKYGSEDIRRYSSGNALEKYIIHCMELQLQLAYFGIIE